MPFPDIDPIAISLGPLAIRWYALAYIFGLLFSLFFSGRLAAQYGGPVQQPHIDSFFTPAILAVIIGGRLGFVLFYDPLFYLSNPLEIFAVWKGGMAFHGAAVALFLFAWWHTQKNNIPFLAFTDIIAVFSPFGVFLGRLANFINAEHWGRVTDMPFGIIFPNAGPLPRHPSQIYEALSEGLLLLFIMIFLAYRTNILRYFGLPTAVCLGLSGLFRWIVEYFRTPDEIIALPLNASISIGQLLSLPMIIGGILLAVYALKSQKTSP
jgi:phosphatidylglycerol:prolipoprotein diacylglycerol transferase